MAASKKRITTDHETKRQTFKEWLSYAAKTSAAVATVSIAAAASALIENLVAAESVRSLSLTFTYLILVVLVTFGLIYFFILVLRERTAYVSRLKQEVTGAFLKALDQSSFNPRRLEERNEQPSPQTTG